LLAFTLVSIAAFPLQAQQVVADGTTQTASGTINTGTLAPPAGYALYALNGGIITSSSPLTLITGGSAANAVQAISGGSISIAEGSTITASGTNASGVFSDNAGVSISGGQITSGLGSTGVIAQNGGTVTMTGTNSVTGGFRGLTATDAPSAIDASQSTQLTVTFTGGSGVLMTNGGLVKLPSSTSNGTSVINVNSSGTGIAAVNTAAGAAGSGITINQIGPGSTGVYAATSSTLTLGNLLIQGSGGVAGVLSGSGSAVTLNGTSSITISGGTGTSFHATAGNVSTQINGVSSAGLLSLSSGSLNAADTSILVTSPVGVGAAAISGGSMTLTGGSITVTGSDSTGVISDATMSLTNVPVTTTGANSAALEVDGGSRLSVTNSSAEAQGSGESFGLLVTGGTATNPNVVAILGGTLTSLQAAAIESENAILNITLSNGARVTGGGGLVLNTIGRSTLNLTSDASTMTGAAFTDATSTSNVALQNGSLWTMTARSASLRRPAIRHF